MAMVSVDDLRAGVLEALYEAVDEVNQGLPATQQLSRSPETVLFGPGGQLDSLGLVNFVTEAEIQIEDRFDISLTLADEKALSQKRSPFRSIESLSDYVCSLLGAGAVS